MAIIAVNAGNGGQTPESAEQPPAFAYSPRPLAGNRQDTLPGRYRGWVMALTMAAFTLAFVGWLNESWLYLFESPIWLNRYTEYAIILAFGLWRIHAERNPYTRKRLIILVSVVTVFWWLIPWLSPAFEPYVGYLWSQPVFPALHTPGTLTFFLTLVLVFLFGRRIICGFGCPCVGIRDTVGFPFRGKTLTGKWAWRLRHTKWFFFVWYVGVMVATQFPPNAWTVSLVGIFALVLGLTYFGTFFIIPVTGNRFYCRYLCPYGATFGLLNHAGFYGIDMDTNRCIDCRRCEQACDMGIPVWAQGKDNGRVTGLEECMGCARCVVSCPTDALAVRDVRNLFKPNMRQHASYLLKTDPKPAMPRLDPVHRPVAERIADWQDAEYPVTLDEIRVQAQRCLDCGVPGCRNACPLGNRIPDWLAAAAEGDWKRAGDLVHEISPLPEVCGRICPQHRLCEGSCTRGRMEGAVTIGAAERTLAQWALENGWRPDVPARRSDRKVAVVGAGPAGLACAERLNREGVQVVVFDRAAQAGGLLYSAAPAFKLNKDLLVHRQTLLTEAGIRFQFGTPVDGEMMGWLLEEHDAVFLGTGAQKSRLPPFPGSALSGVTQSIAWLEYANAGLGNNLTGRSVAVLGGGDTAVDCARTAVRLGARVTLVYRGTRERMRAAPEEIALTEEEGIDFLFEYKPLAFEGERHVESVRFETPEGEKIVAVDEVILAFGQQPDPPPWLPAHGIDTEDDGRIRIDAGGRTSHPQVWAGGDNTHGPDITVTAMAAGQRAAEDILSSFQPVSRLRERFAKAAVPTRTPMEQPLAAFESGSPS